MSDSRYFIAKGKHLVVPVTKQEYEDYWNKKRKEPMTNDEWRKTCSAEEFAKLLSDAMLYGQQCDKDDVTCEECGCPWCKTDSISEWLKQPHNRKEK